MIIRYNHEKRVRSFKFFVHNFAITAPTQFKIHRTQTYEVFVDTYVRNYYRQRILLMEVKSGPCFKKGYLYNSQAKASTYSRHRDHVQIVNDTMLCGKVHLT